MKIGDRIEAETVDGAWHRYEVVGAVECADGDYGVILENEGGGRHAPMRVSELNWRWPGAEVERL